VIKIAAVSDIHAPKYLEEYRRALQETSDFDLLLFAGDLVSKGDWKQLGGLIDITRETYDGDILACFGNEEYDQYLQEFRKESRIKWLEDEKVELELRGVKISIMELYQRRVELIDELLAQGIGELKIVLTHYPPTYDVLAGERQRSWPEMACKKFERVITRRQPDVWFHGHIHDGKKLEIDFGHTLVCNVSLPARGKISVTELPRKTGLEKFL